MKLTTRGWIGLALLAAAILAFAHPWPPLWNSGAGAAIHYDPVSWPNEPTDPKNCGSNCGDWIAYSRFNQPIADPRVKDPSNGGTAPQSYVNVASSCTDKSQPSIYYYLHKDGSDSTKDVLMFRWRVESAAHNYATGPSPGDYSSGNPWSSAQWTVLFDLDGSGYRTLAAHLNGSSGSPAEPVDVLAGIWGTIPTQSVDYSDPSIHLLGHNPTAFIGGSNKLLNFHNSLSPDENWPNGASETVWDYGTTRATKVSSSPCTEYFVDYQIPVAMLDASSSGGPKITRDTPISMLFCTANSLNNPFQKDCAINRTWSADPTKPAPFGDYISFNKTAPYAQPIVSSVAADPPATCPGSYQLTAKVQDALAVQGGVVVPSLKKVDFYYWFDANGDGQATAADSASAWTKITPSAALQAQTLNTWNASWNASSLRKGKYLIGVQAVDDSSLVDDGMVPSGVDNRTFSYLTGDISNKIYSNGTWVTGQQATFPTHSPVQTPSSAENWFGNPDVTGTQVAIVGTAINTCGVSPTIALSRTPGQVAAGGTVGFTITVNNPVSSTSSITLSSLSEVLPTGFSYTNSSTTGTGGVGTSDPAIGGQTLTWSFGTPITIAAGGNVTLTFSSTAPSTAGSYNAVASAITSFDTLTSAPASIIVDSARISLSSAPNAYSITADGSTPLTYTFSYANDSNVSVTGTTLSVPLPTGVTYQSCTGGTACSLSAGNVTFNLGTLAPNSSGTASMTISVPTSYAATSLVVASTLSATAPDSSTVTATSSTTVAVTGLSSPPTPSFTLDIAPNASNVAPGATVTYTLTYTNFGGASASSVSLSTTIPTGMTYSSCSNSCSTGGSTATWTIGSVAAGATATRTLTLTTGNPFTGENPTTSTATLSWSGGTPVVASASVGVNSQICSTYYFRGTSTNVGFDGTKNIATASPVVVSGDTGSKQSVTAPAGTYVEALRFYQDPQTANDVPFSGSISSSIYIDRNNGPSLSIRTTVYDYNSISGSKTQLGQSVTSFGGSSKGLLPLAISPTGTLAKSHRLLWVYEASSDHPSQTVALELQFGGTVTNGMSGGTTFANSNAQFCVTPPANLKLTNTVDRTTITDASATALKYTLHYVNTGNVQATSASLVNTLPSGLTECEYSSDNSTWATCSNVAGNPQSHTFSIGTIAGGASGNVYVRGTVPDGTLAGSTLTDSATLVSSQTSLITAAAATSVVSASSGGTASLNLSLGTDRSNVEPGQAVTYTATVLNAGSAAATNVVVSNTLPVATYFTYGSCTGGCGRVGNVVTWPTIASLAAGSSQTYTYTMNVGTNSLPAGVTVIIDSLDASADSGLTATSNNASISVTGNPLLTAGVTPSPASGLEPNDPITYTITVQNAGAAAANNVAVDAPIPAHVTYAGSISASQGSGSFDANANSVKFDVGTLASGGTATLTFNVKVNSPLTSGNTSIVFGGSVSAANAPSQIISTTAAASAAPILVITNSAPSYVPYPAAVLSSAASGTVLLVDRTDRLALNQLIRIEGSVVRIVALGSRAVTVDTPIAAISGTPLYTPATLTIAYRNDGNADATAAAITQALPAGLGYYDSSPSASTSPLSGNSGNVQWSIGTIAPGTGGTVEITAFPTGATGNFTAVATLSASNAADVTASAATAIGGISVVKSTSTTVRSSGGIAKYTIVATNSLASAETVTMTDMLPQGFLYRANSAQVDSVATAPTFDPSDTAGNQPIWNGVVVPAHGALTVSFDADISTDVGAGTYQNEVKIDAPAGVGVMTFDPLATTAEDVSVLAAATGVIHGYVFKRDGASNAPFDAASDTPLSGVRLELHKNVYDCAVGTDCYVVYTDSNGYFEQVLASGNWILSLIDGTGDHNASWTQIVGSDDNTVAVPDQGQVSDEKGYRLASATHVVSAVAATGGSVSPASRTVNEGDTTTFTVTPDSGYTIDTVSGCGGSLSGSTFTTDAITSDCIVSASFSAIPGPFSIAASASPVAGGTITGAGSYANGSSVTLVATPAAGYTFSNWTESSTPVSTNATFSFTASASRTLVANFTLNGYDVDATAGSGGTISPATATVAHGQSTSFTVSPIAGYHTAAVIGCSGSLSGTTYTTGAITSSCTVSASFARNQYTVTAVAQTGGSITPTSTLVNYGDVAAFSIAISPGYRIVNISGCAGSLANTTFTTGLVTSACAVTASFEPVGPHFGPAPPERVNARALFTEVPKTIAPHAFDADGNELEVTLVTPPKLMPGRHTLTWRALDSLGHEITQDQQFDVWPMVSLSQDLVLGYDASASFFLELNGPAPEYPFAVQYDVTGPGLGTVHTLASGTAVIASGTTKAVAFNTLPQGSALPEEKLTVTLASDVNAGSRATMNISIVGVNVAPEVEIVASQGSRTGTLIARDGGIVTLHALISDANVGDTHSVQWTYPTGLNVQIANDGLTLTFAALDVPAGLPAFTATATDSGSPQMSTRAKAVLTLRNASPSLGTADANENGVTDAAEGWTDAGNGIPAYLNRLTPGSVLPEDAPITSEYLVESEPGVLLKVGSVAQYTGSGGARLTSEHIPTLIASDTITNVGGYFDYEMREVPLGASIKSTIPQRAQIPTNAIYRVWDPESQRWSNFIEDANNKLSSAPGEAGFCPPADSDSYTPGLSQGYWCVQLTVQDGGPNDQDKSKNGVIMKLGGVGAPAATTPAPTTQPDVLTGTSKGGGGAMGIWTLVLVLFGAARRRWKAIASLPLLAVLSTAHADEQSHTFDDRWYVSAQGSWVRNSIDAKDMDARLATQGYVTQTDMSGFTRLGYAVSGGYRYEYFALDLAYVDLGKVTTTIRGTTPLSPEYLRAISKAHPRSGKGPQASVLAFLPLSKNWELLGRLGLFRWSDSLSTVSHSTGQFDHIKVNSTDPVIGIGMRYTTSERWRANLEWSRYRLDGENLNALALSATYRIGKPRDH